MIQKNLDKIIVGAVLAVAASTLLPIAKSTFSPLAASGLQSGTDLLSHARSLIQKAREEVEDIVAEAQFERMKKQMDKEIALHDGELVIYIDEQNIDYHLRQALSHLEMALNQSVPIMQENDVVKKKEIGAKWEGFIGDFLGQVREKGKKSKINLLSFISFPKFR